MSTPEEALRDLARTCEEFVSWVKGEWFEADLRSTEAYDICREYATQMDAAIAKAKGE